MKDTKPVYEKLAEQMKKEREQAPVPEEKDAAD